MGIQGLLPTLKPYAEPVHVKKYAGQRVGIDAYSWLHKGAYACSMQLQGETRQKGAGLPMYVSYCMHRIKMLQYNNVTPVVVFDGGRLPLKALTEQDRQKRREANLEQGQKKLAEGDTLRAQEFYQRAVEITPLMAYELIKVLKLEAVEFVVAPYEADAQIAHLARLPHKKGGFAAVISEDSDLLAYGCKAVLFKMDRYGSCEEIDLQKVLGSATPPAKGLLSFRNFTQDLFLSMCVMAGCDFLPSIPGIGVKRAHALLTKYRNVTRVLSRLKFEKPTTFPEGYEAEFWRAKAIFNHARVYDRENKRLMFLNPIPAELLDEFEGDTEFLGPDLPESRAKAIAEGRLDPITMCAFDTAPSTNASTEFFGGRKDPVGLTKSVCAFDTVTASKAPTSSFFGGRKEPMKVTKPETDFWCGTEEELLGTLMDEKGLIKRRARRQPQVLAPDETEPTECEINASFDLDRRAVTQFQLEMTQGMSSGQKKRGQLISSQASVEVRTELRRNNPFKRKIMERQMESLQEFGVGIEKDKQPGALKDFEDTSIVASSPSTDESTLTSLTEVPADGSQGVSQVSPPRPDFLAVSRLVWDEVDDAGTRTSDDGLRAPEMLDPQTASHFDVSVGSRDGETTPTTSVLVEMDINREPLGIYETDVKSPASHLQRFPSQEHAGKLHKKNHTAKPRKSVGKRPRAESFMSPQAKSETGGILKFFKPVSAPKLFD